MELAAERSQTWSVLESRLEKGACVTLRDGTFRKGSKNGCLVIVQCTGSLLLIWHHFAGFVYAVDPQVPCALLLLKVCSGLDKIIVSRIRGIALQAGSTVLTQRGAGRVEKRMQTSGM